MSEQEIEKISITLPTEEFVMVDFTQDEQPGIAHLNKSLEAFSATDTNKKVFAWHLSLIMLYTDHIEEKMPSKDEHAKLIAFQVKLDAKLKQNGNALFLASITHNGYRELIWRIHNPYPANDIVHDIIEAGDHPHPFDFTLDEDAEWQAAQWHLDAMKAEKPKSNAIPGKYWE